MEILTNPHFFAQFPHVVLTSFTTGAFLVAGISAWKILRKHDLEMFRRSFRIAITIGLLASFVTLFTGHWQAQYLVQSQPMKMAAAEALWETSEDPAPFTVVAKVNDEEKANDFEIQIPYLLSYLSFSKFSGSLEGLNPL